MLQTAIEAVAPGGIVVQVGMGKDRANFPVLDVVFKELDFRGCFRYTNTVRKWLHDTVSLWMHLVTCSRHTTLVARAGWGAWLLMHDLAALLTQSSSLPKYTCRTRCQYVME